MYIAGEPIAFRDLEETDFGFIIPTWCNSTRDVVKGVSRDQLAASSKAACVLALAHADWVIACAKDAEATIYGWACFAPLVSPDYMTIHNQNTAPIYAFTTYPIRRNGLYKAMRGHYENTCKLSGDSRPNTTGRRPLRDGSNGEGRPTVGNT